MKRILFILMVVIAAFMLFYTVKLYIHSDPPQHTTRQTFEEMESWRNQ